MPVRASGDEPDHDYLDIGYSFVTAHADVGRIQESEVRGAAWYPLAVAERLVGGTALRERSAHRAGSVDRTRRTLPVGSGTGSRCAQVEAPRLASHGQSRNPPPQPPRFTAAEHDNDRFAGAAVGAPVRPPRARGAPPGAGTAG